MYTLIMVDDDADVLKINEKYFTREGYTVYTARCASDCLKLIAQHGADCILLDVMMPETSGFDALSEIRKHTMAPVLFLTGKADEASRIKGLMLGADDYIQKPYSLAELQARIIANIRRHNSATAPSTAPSPLRLSFPPLEVDVIKHAAFCDGQDLQLSNQEYELLHMLVSSPRQLVTFEQLGTKIWGSYRPENRQAVMVSISRLRKKMEHPTNISYMIETVWGKGYHFVEDRN